MTSALRVVPAALSHLDTGGTTGPLPFAMTPLLGREEQVARIAERLADPAIRILTLVGPGGVGKSRLAVEVGHTIQSRFDDGVQLVRLAAMSDPALVPVILARALDVRQTIDFQPVWTSAADRHCLLVIDNFEHLLEAAPTLVDVLVACPGVTMLVTSRVPLHVTGEHEHQVPPLATPAGNAPDDPASVATSDAVRLFVDRAMAINPDFRLDVENAGAVSRIARQLDGLPLAIELAAARTRHLSPQAIVERLADPNEALRGGPLDRPPHQRGLRDTIAWSFDLLGRDEQVLFRRLSVCAGGFLPQAAAYICGDDDDPPQIQPPNAVPQGIDPVLDTCIALADKSLIVDVGEFAYQPRFSMLLTIRTFGREELRRIGELHPCERRHALWYAVFAGVAASAIRGPSQTMWLDWLQAEDANIRLALKWHRGQEELLGLARLVQDLGTYWLVRGHLVEGLWWMTIVLSSPQVHSIPTSLRADLSCTAGWLALRQGLPDSARAFAERALADARNGERPDQQAAALRLLGDIEGRLGQYGPATGLMREALGLYRLAGNLTGVADTLTGLAGVAMDTGRFDQAEGIFQDAVAAATGTGDAIILARAIDSLSVAVHAQDRPAEAITHAERALHLYRTHGNVRGIAIAMDHVGKCSRSLGNLARAWSCHQESLAWRRKVGDPRGLVVWLEAVAALLAASDAFAAAATVLGATETIRQRGAFPPHGQEAAQRQWTMDRIEQHLPAHRVTAAVTRGSRLALTEVVDLAYAEAERTAMPRAGRPAEVITADAARTLTPRELDVARLLADDLSNKDIAARLLISPRTVSTHVTVILGKLGVRSRREIPRLD